LTLEIRIYMKGYNVVVFALKTTVDGNVITAEPDVVNYLLCAKSKKDAEEKALAAYDALPDKVDHTTLRVFVLELQLKRVMQAMRGAAVGTGLPRLEKVDALDAEIIY
jgi:hypothetical protein